jgi:hypothetical protein
LGVSVRDDPVNLRTNVAISGGGTAPSQTPLSLVNGLNSNVVIPGSPAPSTVYFSGNTGPVILGGLAFATQPTGGQEITLVFTEPYPVAIRNLDASSTLTKQLLTGSAQDAYLTFADQPTCKVQYDATSGVTNFRLISPAVHRPREFNVLNYGLDPTGTNANDTALAALNTVITTFLESSATAAGQVVTVFFPRGTYLFASSVTAFPNGVRFEGSEWGGYTTILEYSGTGIFWQSGSRQSYRDLSFASSLSNSFSATPGQAAVITAIGDSGGLIQVTTATAHGYVTGDIIGIHGLPANTGANCDPSNPWTITRVSSTQYTLNGSTYTSGHEAPTLTVNGATNASPIVVSTTTAHGLTSGQLVYIASVDGNTAANGPMRVYGIPASATTFAIASNVLTTPTTGSGAYTSGGAVTVGGVGVSYSHNAQVGLSVAGTTSGLVHLYNCSFSGFKYNVRLDGAEDCVVEKCNFTGGTPGLGYTSDRLTNDGTHSGADIAQGAFTTYDSGAGLGITNGNIVRECTFNCHYYATFHHDGTEQLVTGCNYEQPVMMLVQEAQNVTLEHYTNDETSFCDSLGVVQTRNDVGDSGVYGLTIRNGQAVGPAGIDAMVYLASNVDVYGLCVSPANVWTGGGYLVQSNGACQGGVKLDGNVAENITNLSDINWAPPNILSGTAVGSANSGTSIGHYLTPQAALDVAFFPSGETLVAELLWAPNEGLPVYHQKQWTTASTFYGGSMQAWDSILSVQSDTEEPAATAGMGLGWTYLAASASAVNIGPTNLPGVYASGVITATIQANIFGTEATNSSWMIRQRYYKNGSAITLGAVIEYEVIDNIGVTAPTLALTGSFPNDTITALVNSSSASNLNYSVQFRIDHCGA